MAISWRRLVAGTCLLLHFGAFVTVSVRQTYWLIGHGYTVLRAENTRASSTKDFSSGAAAENVSRPSLWRALLLGYRHATGTEASYGFFAPSVSDSYKLVFQVEKRDGTTTTHVPSVGSESAGLRFASLLDRAGGTEAAFLRQILVESVAREVWAEHREARSMRAVVGRLRVPAIAEYERGTRPIYEVIASYSLQPSVSPQR